MREIEPLIIQEQRVAKVLGGDVVTAATTWNESDVRALRDWLDRALDEGTRRWWLLPDAAMVAENRERAINFFIGYYGREPKEGEIVEVVPASKGALPEGDAR